MSGRSDHRKHVDDNFVDDALHEVDDKISERLEQKGQGTFASIHEILGILSEEFDVELKDAVHRNNVQDVRVELLDIAVGCLFGVACIDAKTMDW